MMHDPLTPDQRRHMRAAHQETARLKDVLDETRQLTGHQWLSAASIAGARADHLDQMAAGAPVGAGTGAWSIAARASRDLASRCELYAHLADAANNLDGSVD